MLDWLRRREDLRNLAGGGGSPSRDLSDQLGQLVARVPQLLLYATELSSAGRHQDAIEALDEIAAALDQVSDARMPQEPLQTLRRTISLMRLNDEAVGMVKSGKVREGADLLEQSLAQTRDLQNPVAESKILEALSSAYWNLGRPSDAERALRGAIDAVKRAGMALPEAMFRNNLGVLYRQIGQPDEALLQYGRALGIRRAMGDRHGEASVLANIGVTYEVLGALDDARSVLEQALVLQREFQDPELGLTLMELGTVCERLGFDDDSHRYYEQSALRLQQDLHEQQLAHAPRAATLHNLAVMCGRLRWTNEAAAFAEQAVTAAGQNLRLQLRPRALLGDLMLEMGREQAAGDEYLEELRLARQIGDTEQEVRALTQLGLLARRVAEHNDARAWFEAAVDKVEQTRAELLTQDLRATYLTTTTELYEAYVSLLIEQGSPKLALEATERGRARSFLDLLAEARGRIRQGVNPELQQQEQHLLIELRGIRDQLIEARSELTGTAGTAKLPALVQREQELRLTYQLNQAEIRRRSPRYAALIAPEVWDYAQIQAFLDDKTALLEFALGTEASFLFVVSRENFEVYRLPARAEIELQVKELLDAVTARAPRYPHGYELYRTLLAPAEHLLAGKRLLIVPDGVLHYLPFSLLLTRPLNEKRPSRTPQRRRTRPAGRTPGTAERNRSMLDTRAPMDGHESDIDFGKLPYLIRRHAIAYAPSATIGGILRRTARTRPRSSEDWDGELGAFADPLPDTITIRDLASENTFELSSTRIAVSHTRGRLARIPSTADEVWGVAQQLSRVPLPKKERPEFFENIHVSLRTGSRATKSEVVAITSGSKRYRFFHLATHGLLDAERPQYSGLVFTPDEGSESYWQMFEIFNAHIPSELVVLSACETGLGRLLSGEGLVGLTRAFIYAGAASVCASLWTVADRSATDLMLSFYRGMLDGRSNVDALRDAQVAMLDRGDGLFAHPFYWAPFVLVGEGV